MGQRAAIYLRISDDREGRELGVERQDEDARRLAERDGDTVVAVYTDNDIGASSKSRKWRPEYQQLLSDARSGHFTKIIAYTSGRLTRRPREHEDQIDLAQDYGVEFRYVSSPSFDLNTASGRRVARTLAAQDAGESEDISERVQRQKEQAAADGRWLGGNRPYGYEPDGVTIRPDEAAEIQSATDAILSGMSMRAVTQMVNDNGVGTSRGEQWDRASLRRALLRPRNAGLMSHRGEIVGAAQWPAIVSEDRWRALVSVLTDPDRRTAASNTVRWLGSGLYVCGACKRPEMRASTSSRGRKVYRCWGRDTSVSGHVSRNAIALDELIEELIVRRLQAPDAVELLAEPQAEVDVAALHAERTAKQRQLDELAEAFSDLEITRSQLKSGSAKLRSRLEEINAELARAGQGNPLVGLVDTPNPGAVWEQLDIGRQRAVLDYLMTVTVLPSPNGRKPGGGYFSPDYIDVDWKR